ncbi:MAG TPA: YlzJ-like family protein [Peptococcaceae bacterium]|jgi:hypothetical protein|nr:hypothetical protein [Clostridia bacterium]HOB81887.1 YlzJ-like family protein [Peptococcaceae bacterium]HPZ71873.1 YlzJ-like family protein [Peptococcaceae bacterium]HQD53855.1 YlzJ-like family protein [Peptococcaceae bacterium]
MIMYTPVPPELLWFSEENNKYQLLEGIVEGIPVQLRVVEGQLPIVERVLSTEPGHFLNRNCQPGRVIKGDCTK